MLTTDGNRGECVFAKASLTVRLTGRSDTKVGESDPDLPSGRGSAQRIKVIHSIPVPTDDLFISFRLFSPIIP